MKKSNRIEPLHSFIQNMPDEQSREAFAVACGSTIAYIRQVAYGFKDCSADLAIAIAENTNWIVTPHQIRPQTFRNQHDGLPLSLFVQRAQQVV